MSETNQFDLQKLNDHGSLKSVTFLETTPSTNDWAKQQIQQSGLPDKLVKECPKLLLTERQTAGRGQKNRNWWSGQGSLTFSIIETFPDSTPNLTTSLATALALTELICGIDCNIEPRIKWPNDLFVNGRKLGGILIETVRHQGTGFKIVGIGINVNNSLSHLPEAVRKSAISLQEITGKHQDMTPFLTNLLDRYFAVQNRCQTEPKKVVQDCLNRSQHTLGEPLCFRLPDGRSINGEFAGYSVRGGVLIKQTESPAEYLSGTIELPNY